MRGKRLKIIEVMSNNDNTNETEIKVSNKGIGKQCFLILAD